MSLVKKLIELELLAKDWAEFSSAFELAEEPLKQSSGSYPETKNVFRAFNECPVSDLRVVILGQDPYHDKFNGKPRATGLAFDNERPADNEKGGISPSLFNIYKEAENDVGGIKPKWINQSMLEHWPHQGVLLLNTALTVMPGKAGSHAKLWEPFTKQIIADIQKKDDIVWILWGNHAKKFKDLITNQSHHIIEGGHPSPLNKTVPFAGGKYFSKTNEILTSLNKTKIIW